MGTWGSGNLESDGALDSLSELSSNLIDSIWKALQSKESWEADEIVYDDLFVRFEWLFTLEKADLICLWNMPTPEEFNIIEKIWIAGWSEYFDGLSGPEFKVKRLAVIQKSFDHFRALCIKSIEMRNV